MEDERSISWAIDQLAGTKPELKDYTDVTSRVRSEIRKLSKSSLLSDMMTPLGFTHEDEQGFISFHRTHPDGRKQKVRFIWWSNPKHADSVGTPMAHLAVCLSLDVGMDDRYKVALTAGGMAHDQEFRPWSEVEDEFVRVFMPILDASAGDGRAMMDHLGNANRLRPVNLS